MANQCATGYCDDGVCCTNGGCPGDCAVCHSLLTDSAGNDVSMDLIPPTGVGSAWRFRGTVASDKARLSGTMTKLKLNVAEPNVFLTPGVVFIRR